MAANVDISVKDSVLELKINRPEKKNAINRAMNLTLADALKSASVDREIRAVLITGTGESFTSGADLEDFMGAIERGKADEIPSPFVRGLANFAKPIVAAVNGHALGVGTTMLLHCDLVYASVSARFQMSFVDLGLVPEAGSSLLLPLLMGHQRAAELLMLAEPFDVSRAKVLGLVNAVYPANELMAQAREKAKELAAKPPAAMRATKQLLKQGRSALGDHMALEAAAFQAQLKSPEAREAVKALLEKRKPDFSKFR